MDNKTIIEKYESKDVKSIFGYMYGNPYVDVCRNGNTVQQKDRIIEIKKESLHMSRNRDGLIFIFGSPGPDFNHYKFSDYGITWAFTRKEIEGAEETSDG